MDDQQDDIEYVLYENHLLEVCTAIGGYEISDDGTQVYVAGDEAMGLNPLM